MNWIPAQNPDFEPNPVKITRGEWVDARRNNRVVPYKITSPESLDALYRPPTQSADGKLPVIIWSHGLGGGRDGAGFLARYIASYGYVVVNVQHAGTDTSLWEGKKGHPWDVIRATHIPRKATLQRLQDIPFVIDQLNHLQDPMMDLTRLGMSGHSFGAMTTQIMAGQTRGVGRRRYRLFEPRFKAGIVYSPVTVFDKKGHAAKDFYATIETPCFFMTGTQDHSPIVKDFTYEQRLEVFEHAGGLEQMALIGNGSDHMIYNGSRGQLGDVENRPRQEQIIRLSSLAFWDYHLKADKAAEAWLKNDFASWLGDDGTYILRT